MIIVLFISPDIPLDARFISIISIIFSSHVNIRALFSYFRSQRFGSFNVRLPGHVVNLTIKLHTIFVCCVCIIGSQIVSVGAPDGDLVGVIVGAIDGAMDGATVGA